MLPGSGLHTVEGEALLNEVQGTSGISRGAVSVGLGQQQHRGQLVVAPPGSVVHRTGDALAGHSGQLRDGHRQQYLSLFGQLRIA